VGKAKGGEGRRSGVGVGWGGSGMAKDNQKTKHSKTHHYRAKTGESAGTGPRRLCLEGGQKKNNNKKINKNFEL
jgi:hypothetical protein